MYEQYRRPHDYLFIPNIDAADIFSREQMSVALAPNLLLGVVVLHDPGRVVTPSVALRTRVWSDDTRPQASAPLFDSKARLDVFQKNIVSATVRNKHFL